MDFSKETETKDERRLRKALARIAKANEESTELGMPTDVPIRILCVRFGNRYGRDYVERLRNMVARHITIPYEFVCLTDDLHPIEGVRSIVQPNANYARGWWHKVHMFDPTLPLSGRILYFDLDVVIHNSINKLATMFTDDFVGIHDFNRAFHSNWHNLNSSVMAWNHGSQNHIWHQFILDPKAAQRMPGDQDWIWKLCKDRIKFWPREWVQSYKWEIRKRDELTMVNGKRRFKDVQHAVEPPRDCSVTVFHGDPKPQDVEDRFVVDNWR